MVENLTRVQSLKVFKLSHIPILKYGDEDESFDTLYTCMDKRYETQIFMCDFSPCLWNPVFAKLPLNCLHFLFFLCWGSN